MSEKEREGEDRKIGKRAGPGQESGLYPNCSMEKT